MPVHGYPLTDENIEALEALVIDGADGYGEGTHWIERRWPLTLKMGARGSGTKAHASGLRGRAGTPQRNQL